MQIAQIRNGTDGFNNPNDRFNVSSPSAVAQTKATPAEKGPVEEAVPTDVSHAQHEATPQTEDPLNPNNLFDDIPDESRPGRAEVWGDQSVHDVSQTAFQLPRRIEEDEQQAVP